MLPAKYIINKLSGDDLPFKCGGCNILFENVYLLHDHVRNHVEGGSYNYNHTIQTAFPVSASINAFTQTCLSDLEETHTNNESLKADSINSVADFTINYKKGYKSSHKDFGIDAMSNYSDIDSFENEITDDNDDWDDLNVEETRMNFTNECTTEGLSQHQSDFNTLRKNGACRLSSKHSKKEIKSNTSTKYAVSSKTRVKRLRKADSRATEIIKTNGDFANDKKSDVVKNQLHNHDNAEKIKKGITVKTYKISVKELSKLGKVRVSLNRIDDQKIKQEVKIEYVPDLKTSTIETRKDSSNELYTDYKPVETDQGPASKDNVTLTKEIDSDLDKLENKDLDGIKVKKKKIKCEKCLKFIKPSSMRKHLVVIHNEPRRPRGAPKKDCYVYKCNKCDKFVRTSRRSRHEKIHLKIPDSEPVICEICGKLFSSCKSLSNHKKVHSPKHLICRHCKFVSTTKEECGAHAMKHRAQYKPCTCKVCGMVLSQNKGLLEHVRSIHMGIKRSECDVCRKQFYSKANMEIHRAVHFEPSLSCSYCGRKFRDPCGLKRHERIHTGETKYSCHICKQSFIQSTPYWIHLEKRHSISKAEAIALRKEHSSVEHKLKEKLEHDFRANVDRNMMKRPKC